MSSENGKRRDSTSLQAVEARIAARHEAEAMPDIVVEQGTGSHSIPDDEPCPDTADDPLTAWKRRRPGEPVTLEQIHAGLIATCEYSEAAIEGGIKMAADVHDVVQTVELRTQQIAMISAKVEATQALAHQIDEDSAHHGQMLVDIRKDVQSLKDDMLRVKDATQQIPAIKDLLIEILGRLPESNPSV